MLLISSANKENLIIAINKFYYSKNYFINAKNEVENTVTKKITGYIKEHKKRFQYHIKNT